MKKLLIGMLLFSAAAFGSATVTRNIDTVQNTTGGSALSVPSSGAAFLSDAATQTVTNKSISGATNTLTAIPTSALTGSIGVANGGTGLTSITTSGIIVGNGTGTPTIVGPGTQFQTLQAGASGVPTYGAVNLGQSAAVTGTLPVSNGGTGAATLTSGSILVGAGTSAVTSIAPGTSGNVLTSNGTVWSSTAPSSTSPVLNGSQASPQSVTAAGGVTLTGLSYMNYAFIVSNSGAVTVTATPSITACTAAGQQLVLIGESNTNQVLLQDTAALAGSKLQLNGNWQSGLNKDITFSCDGNGFWVETARNI